MRCPTLRTISASLLVVLLMVGCVCKNSRYWEFAMLCNSDSGNSFSWLRPVTAFLLHAIASDAARNKVVNSLVIIFVFVNNSMIIPKITDKNKLMFKAYFFRHDGAAGGDPCVLEWEPCFHYPGVTALYSSGE